MEWYVVNTQPRREDFAEQNLKRLGIETFSPRIRQEKVIRRDRRTVIAPLFPGYIFARFNLDTHYRAVSYAHGVQKLVAFGDAPTTVDEEIIDSIKSRISEGYIHLDLPLFKPGQLVRIDTGPLQGLEAVFEKEMNDHQRSMLFLGALSYQARVVVNLEQVVGIG
jgi:transcriptional antiterminator RfaH